MFWRAGRAAVSPAVLRLYTDRCAVRVARPRSGPGGRSSALLDSARVLSMSGRPDDRDGGEVTKLLRAWSDGDADAFERVLPLVYDELHRMAARYLVGERSSISLQATALVNELCLRLLGWDPVRWQNRGHFFGVSAQMMRRVLVDIARRRRAERRGGPNAVRVPLDGDRRRRRASRAPTCSRSTRRSRCSPWRTRARPRSSSFASSAASRSRRPPRRSGYRSARFTRTGHSRGRGCTER